MGKWAVILTVIALCFLGVLSQTNSNVQSTSPEENNSTASSLNANEPSTSTSTEVPPASAKENGPVETNSKENITQTPSSTFPPLVHNEHPETPASVEATPATTLTTTPTMKAPEIKEAVTETRSATTHKPNSSNRLDLSLIALLSSGLIWKFNY